MIHITGFMDSSSDEYQNALKLKDLILDAWPTVKNSSRDHIHIVVGAKCHGQIVRDIDLLVLGIFKSGITYKPFLHFTNRDGEPELPDEVIVESFCLVIELKAHSSPNISFNGTNVEVYYPKTKKWHNASKQNEDQKQSLINYLRLQGFSRMPWVIPLIWLNNVSAKDLPKRPHNILGSEANWELFINVIGQLFSPETRNGRWVLNAGIESYEIIKEIAFELTKVVTPTAIDRKRMEQINQQLAAELELQELVGKQLLLLRGRGGTGKTVNLLQLAKYLYDERAARVLILTYNRALVADLRRLMTIMGIGDGFSEQCIQIQTIYSFFYLILQGLGLFSKGEEEFIEKYIDYKKEALELLNSGAITFDDIQALIKSDISKFGWDFIFVDEGQDWPKDERDLLFKVFSYNFFAVADGIDQLIRNQTPANWRGELSSKQVKIVPLKRCLRMKAGLTSFVSSFAAELGLQQSEWEANQFVPGGRVIIYESDTLETAEENLNDLINITKAAGNEPIDMLFCVPPAMVHDFERSPSNQKPIIEIFNSWGLKTWDGTTYSGRDSYPTENDQLRMVQYESCRGLEGWSVILFGFDNFYSSKLEQIQRNNNDTTLAKLQVARWSLIPLTRGMDTIFIHISTRPSFIKNVLLRVAMKHPELIEWNRP